MKVETNVTINETVRDRYSSKARAEIRTPGVIIGSKDPNNSAIEGTITFHNSELQVGQVVKVTFETETLQRSSGDGVKG